MLADGERECRAGVISRLLLCLSIWRGKICHIDVKNLLITSKYGTNIPKYDLIVS